MPVTLSLLWILKEYCVDSTCQSPSAMVSIHLHVPVFSLHDSPIRVQWVGVVKILHVCSYFLIHNDPVTVSTSCTIDIVAHTLVHRDLIHMGTDFQYGNGLNLRAWNLMDLASWCEVKFQGHYDGNQWILNLPLFVFQEIWFSMFISSA